MSDLHKIHEELIPGPAVGLAALLGVPAPDDEVLPTGWHWVYLLERPRQEDLGVDGHPIRNVFPNPPAAGMRRMWAGGSIRSKGPLRLGDTATRRSWVAERADKYGRTGKLTFVTVEHEVEQAGRVVISERQDIVYRERDDDSAEALAPDLPPVHAATGSLESDEWALPISPTFLFRFSALTYNSHRIHYDRDYARAVEGYPGLVTHGPLQALAMMESARAKGVLEPGALATFEYRLMSPLFEHQGLVARTQEAAAAWRTSVRDVGGRETAIGQVLAG